MCIPLTFGPIQLLENKEFSAKGMNKGMNENELFVLSIILQ